MGAYGGGQYELGVGRGQIQLPGRAVPSRRAERHRARRLRRARSRARPARRARSIRHSDATGFRRADLDFDAPCRPSRARSASSPSPRSPRCSSSRPAPTRSSSRRPASRPPRRRILGARAAERMDAKKSREHFRAAIAAARPQERLQLRRMAEASLALAERRAGDLKVATEKLGGTPPTNRQLLMLRVMGVIAPPPSAGDPAPGRRRPAADRWRSSLLLALGFGIVKLSRCRSAASAPRRGSGASCSSPSCSACSRSSGAGGRDARAAKAAEQRAASRYGGHTVGLTRFRAARRWIDRALPPFWTLVEAHGDELLVHARRLAGDEHAEDVLQDALLRALRAYPRLRHAEHLRAWLYRVTTSAAIDLHRSRAARGGHRRAAGRSHLRRLRRRRLRGADRAAARDGAHGALRLRFVDDLDYDGIADRARLLAGRRAPARIDRRPHPPGEAPA